MNAEHIILSRMLPKTGMNIIAVAGSDGNLQKGWWKGRTLDTNRERFVDKTISYGQVVIDRATGLMWVKDGDSPGCNDGEQLPWEASVQFGERLNFAGFTDWRLPNIRELASIINYKRQRPAIDPIFTTTYYDYPYWSSTLYSTLLTYACYVDFDNGDCSHTLKDIDYYVRAVRTL